MDLSFISDFFVSVSQFFQSIWDFLWVGIYDFVKEVMAYATKAAIYTYIQISIFLVDVAYEVVQDILVDLNVAAQVESAYNSIPGQMRNTLAFFGVPEALTVIFSAVPTRMAMKFVPFIGR
ncbi:DUF2523 domain-containing protein [Azotobacter chroococcum]|uniref:DUF2523 family protein n=1 Tax=Azotobacter chroococcum TaxID=353 RepID=UPI00103BECAF|nr:DUF2523 family protein [Azotobacter chroococcum]TBW03706.1 DUF2523 domain-containing protein [Azotobacter chroococcum]